MRCSGPAPGWPGGRTIAIQRQPIAKCVELYQAQKIRGFLHLYDGEEAVAAGVMGALQPGDAVVATYREHGHALAHGVSMNSILAEMLGKQEGCSRGRGGSMHLFDASTRFMGGNAIVGAGLPLAAGLAMADQRLRPGAITACFFGEGAVGEGAFHETMNLAEIWQLPMLFVCENNRYAMGVPLDISEAETDIYRKAQAYRTRDEIAEWKQRDPIERLRTWMVNNRQITAAELENMEAAIGAEIAAAVAFAEAGTLESVDDLERFVLMDSVVQETAA